MMGLLVVRDKLKDIYAQHEMYVYAAFKFLLVLIGMMLIKINIGYMEQLGSIPVILAVSVLSAFLPLGLVILILAAVILANIYALSMQLAIVSLCILLVMFIIYYRFTPKDSALLILIPMLFFLKIPYLIPIVSGLIGTPVTIVAVAFGTVVYYMINIIGTNASIINNMEVDSSTSQIQYFLDLLIENKEMMFTIGVFLVVIVIVYYIKRMSINNSWTTAIIVGGCAQLVMIIAGSLALDTKQSIVVIVIGCVVSILLSLVLQFFVFSVDYSRTEHTQFEDDEYYYYVKAVPKINVAAPEMNVKRINAQRKKKNRKINTSRK